VWSALERDALLAELAPEIRAITALLDSIAAHLDSQDRIAEARHNELMARLGEFISAGNSYAAVARSKGQDRRLTPADSGWSTLLIGRHSRIRNQKLEFGRYVLKQVVLFDA
jgi:hypothetical protein